MLRWFDPDLTLRELQYAQQIVRKAAHVLIESNYYPTRFERRVNPYVDGHARAPRLDLPFPAELFDDVVFADDL